MMRSFTLPLASAFFVAIAGTGCKSSTMPSGNSTTTTSSSTTSTTTTTVSGGGGTFTLSGTVTDDATGAPIPAAEPEILSGPNAGKKTPSGSNGFYSIPGLSPASFTVRFRAPAYDNADRNATISNSNVTLNVAMHRSPTTTSTSTSTSTSTTSTSTTTTTVNAELRADFTWTPDPCTMTGTNAVVDCTVNGSSSTGAITQYTWSYKSRTATGVTHSLVLDCGIGGGVQVGVDVTLTVQNAAGTTASTTKTITLVKKGACGF